MFVFFSIISIEWDKKVGWGLYWIIRYLYWILVVYARISTNLLLATCMWVRRNWQKIKLKILNFKIDIVWATSEHQRAIFFIIRNFRLILENEFWEVSKRYYFIYKGLMKKALEFCNKNGNKRDKNKFKVL